MVKTQPIFDETGIRTELFKPDHEIAKKLRTLSMNNFLLVLIKKSVAVAF